MLKSILKFVIGNIKKVAIGIVAIIGIIIIANLNCGGGNDFSGSITLLATVLDGFSVAVTGVTCPFIHKLTEKSVLLDANPAAAIAPCACFRFGTWFCTCSFTNITAFVAQYIH